MTGASLRNLFPSIYQLTGFLFTVLALLVAITAYALVDRVPPRVDLMGHAARPAFRQGDEFAGTRIVTVQRACPGKSVRWVTSHADPRWVMQLPDTSLYTSNIGDGPLPRRITIAVAAFNIPLDTPPGRYAYHVRGVFWCNRAQEWLQFPILIDAPVIEFTVIPANADPAMYLPPPRLGTGSGAPSVPPAQPEQLLRPGDRG